MIDQEPDLTQKRIAFQLGMTAGNLTQILNKLEATNMLSRHQMSCEKCPRITVNGKSLINKIRPEIEELEGFIFQSLSDEKGNNWQTF